MSVSSIAQATLSRTAEDSAILKVQSSLGGIAKMVKATVCKTVTHGFESHSRLASKKMIRFAQSRVRAG